MAGGLTWPDTFRISGTGPGLPWKGYYWLIAATPAILLFGSDFVEILLFEHARAPNAGTISQIFLLLGFYALWPLVPRLAWGLAGRWAANMGRWPLGVLLAFFGAVANILHMMVLALVLRYLYSPPGWGLADFFYSVGELWIQNAGLWFFVYACTSATILWLLRVPGENSQGEALIYKIRQGTRTVAVDMSSVDWVEACGNYAQLHRAGVTYLVRKSLTAIEKDTQAHGFVRSHRGALVNMASVKAVVNSAAAGGHAIELNSGEKVPLGRRRVTLILEKLGG